MNAFVSLYVGNVSRRFALISSIFLLASSVSASSPREKSQPIDVFTAIEDGLAKVVVIPRNSKRLTVQIKNLSEQPLTVKLPEAFAAAPVLAQFQQPGLVGLDQRNQGNQLPQALGVAGPRNGNANGNLFQGAVFNVPPGKVIRKKLDCLCLEHGRPDPTPHHPYAIKPLSDHSKDPTIHKLLVGLGRGAYSQRVAQLTAWHLCNKMSWDELSKLTVRIVNGQRYRQFSVSEIATARSIVARLEKGSKSKKDRAPTRSVVSRR